VEGTTVGLSLGALEGASDGFKVGALVLIPASPKGSRECLLASTPDRVRGPYGRRLGALLGPPVGDWDGCRDGAPVGA
jgi:hypothetical protein